VCFCRENNRNNIVTPLPTLPDIPDPKVDPLNVINSLLAVLHEMGPWCTQRAAQHFYHCNEKLKVKTPHERHYLLYCLVSTALIQLHSMCDNAFQRHQGPGGDTRQTIERYSSPKVPMKCQGCCWTLLVTPVNGHTR